MKLRHKILMILFFGWVVSYLNRMVMTVAIPYIAIDFSLSPVESGAIISAFFLGYAVFQVPGGIWADKFGPRRVSLASISGWTFFAVLTGFMSALKPMFAIRALFGAFTGIFPAATWKTVANWFPAKERSTANGFMMSSNFFGPAIAPLFVLTIMSFWGWRAVFYFLLIPDLILFLLVWRYSSDTPENHPKITAKELAEIKGQTQAQHRQTLDASAAQKASFASMIRSPTAWKCFFIWFFFDITFWGFMSWVPSYLVNERGYEMLQMGIATSIPFFAGTIGLILGGWISDKFFANKRALLVGLSNILAGLSVYFSYHASPEEVLAIMSLTGFLIAFAFGATWGLPLSVIPTEIMGVATGFINMAGQIAGCIAPLLLGFLIQKTGNYYLAFMVLAGSPLIAAAIALSVRKARL